jgi:hypothetical protein
MRFPAISFAALMLGTMLFAQQPSEIVGDYIEARSNHVFGGYCEWSGEAETGGREAVLAWHFRAGEYHGISVAGVKAVAVLVGHATLSIGSPPRNSIVFLDGIASSEQQRAAQSLLREQYGQLVGEILKVNLAPIEFYRDADVARLRVGEVLNVSMRKARLPEDAVQGAKRWYDPFIPLADATLGTALNNSFNGQDFSFHWEYNQPAITGFFGRFRLAPVL